MARHYFARCCCRCRCERKIFIDKEQKEPFRVLFFADIAAGFFTMPLSSLISSHFFVSRQFHFLFAVITLFAA
jgi:hypothetical protein